MEEYDIGEDDEGDAVEGICTIVADVGGGGGGGAIADG